MDHIIKICSNLGKKQHVLMENYLFAQVPVVNIIQSIKYIRHKTSDYITTFNK